MKTTLTALLRRGLLAGLLASLISSAFSYFIAERVLDRAVELEGTGEAAERAAHLAAVQAVEHAEVFSRSTQHLGLVAATVATGLALGALFAIAYWLIYQRDEGSDGWARSLRLSAAAFAGVWLLPFLRYPANPPGVGDPATIAMRTSGWLGAAALGTVCVILAWRLHDRMKSRGSAASTRHLAIAGVLLTGAAMSFLLPGDRDAIDFPAALLWDFRLLSITTSMLLWSVLGASFGLLGERAARQSVRGKTGLAAVEAAGTAG